MRLPEGAVEVEAGSECLWLLPERAAYWPRQRMLLVADAHMGKDAAFRTAGLAVPSGPTGEDLARLATLIERYRASRVVFLGDLVHNRIARDAATAAFVAWRRRFNGTDIVLVRGNHDRGAGDPPADWDMRCVDEPLAIGGLALCHVPHKVPGTYAIAGHVHPAARLGGRGGDTLRLPCFFFTADYAIMPAFGSFTGMAVMKPSTQDRVYVVAGEQICLATRK